METGTPRVECETTDKRPRSSGKHLYYKSGSIWHNLPQICQILQHRAENGISLHIFLIFSRDHRSQKRFETMSRDMIDTFRNTTPTVKQKFFRKKLHRDNYMSHGLMLENMICQSRFFSG